jgi:hypothetical protein
MLLQLILAITVSQDAVLCRNREKYIREILAMEPEGKTEVSPIFHRCKKL